MLDPAFFMLQICNGLIHLYALYNGLKLIVQEEYLAFHRTETRENGNIPSMNIWFSNHSIRATLTFAVLAILFGISASTLQAQNTNFGGNRFFRTTITMHDKPLMAEVIFIDTEGNTIVQGAPLINVITRAYGLRSYQIVDGPDWIYTSRLYDIEAIAPPSFVESNEALMLQALLADRFGFEGIKTSREIPAMVIGPGNNDPKLELVTDTFKPGFRLQRSDAEPSRKTLATFKIDELATLLSREFDQPVFNQTGLTGRYRLELDTSSITFTNKAITASMQIKPLLQQAGLTLESTAALTEVLVVSRITRPVLDD